MNDADRIWESVDAADSQPENRASRRWWAKHVAVRQVRVNIVGFGLWRKPQRWHARRAMFKMYEEE